MITDKAFGMPYSRDGEISALGACLINKDALAEASGLLFEVTFPHAFRHWRKS